MMEGMYRGANGLDRLERQMEVISSNLANMQTAGHRRTILSFGALADADQTASIGAAGGSDLRGENLKSVDFSAGIPLHTERKLDVALNGDGFFEIKNGDQSYFTRDGAFYRNESGEIVTAEGLTVQGDNGPIVIDPTISSNDLTIDARGEITANGNSLGKIRTVAFEDNQQLLPVGPALFTAPDTLIPGESTARVVQGSREMSNVSAVTELVSLITTSRQYEAMQKTMNSMSETMQQNMQS
jgi:flagellar basal-body rod protein FlgF